MAELVNNIPIGHFITLLIAGVTGFALYKYKIKELYVRVSALEQKMERKFDENAKKLEDTEKEMALLEARLTEKIHNIDKNVTKLLTIIETRWES